MCIEITNIKIEAAIVERGKMSFPLNPEMFARILEDRELDQALDPENMARAATAEYAVVNQDNILFDSEGIEEEVLIGRLGIWT